jgi:hypothetical protein
MPIIGLIGIIIINNLKESEKFQNIFSLSFFSLLAFLLLTTSVFYIAFGKYSVDVFKISLKQVNLNFIANQFNLIFGLLFVISFMFLDIIFRNSFVIFEIGEKYKLYSKHFFCLCCIYILFIFCDSIILSIMLYMASIISSMFLINNSDLNDIRKAYSTTFFTGMISSIILLIISAFYVNYSGNTDFTTNIKNFNLFIPDYWLIIILIFLVFLVFIYPLYSIFKEKIFYEDLIPLFLICIFPFTIINTFLLFKFFYGIFFVYAEHIKITTLYIGFFLNLLLFFIALFFIIKHRGNNLKICILSNIIIFLIFFEQFLLISNSKELVLMFSNFLVLILIMILTIVSYSNILFVMLKTKIINIKLLYEKYRTEILFYLLSLFLLIFFNFISFFSLNFHNFSILYLINFIQIFLTFILFITYIYILLFKKNVKQIDKKSSDIEERERFSMLIPQIVLLVLISIIFVFKYQIYRSLIFLK